VNILVVGAGVMGANHCRTLNELSEVKRVAVVEPSESAREALRKRNFEKTVFYASLEEALRNEEPRAAIVAVPTHLHYAVCDKLLEAGVHVLVEKPITDKIDEAEKLVAKAAAKKLVLAVGHIERCNPAVQALKKHVAAIGTPVYASTHRFGMPTDRDVGPSFIDQAVHDVDVISFIVNEYPREVQAVERRFVDKRSDDCCAALYEFDGFFAAVEANRATPIKTRELILCGTKGSARLDYITQELVIATSDKETQPQKFSSFDELVLRVGRGAELKPYFVKQEPLRVELENFLKCVEGKAKPVASGEDGLRALAAVIAGHEAAQSGKKTRISV
jgi:UDP-N-acetylglucosamine 3-dehydrogenase